MFLCLLLLLSPDHFPQPLHYAPLLKITTFCLQPQVDCCTIPVRLNSHLFDLQVWTRHSGQPAYRKEAKLYLPAKTLEEIEEHEDWHQELISLQDRKREVENCDRTCMNSVGQQTSVGRVHGQYKGPHKGTGLRKCRGRKSNTFPFLLLDITRLYLNPCMPE